jgi:hypothetical protein
LGFRLHWFQSNLIEPQLYPFRLNRFEVPVQGPFQLEGEAKELRSVLALAEPAQHWCYSTASLLRLEAKRPAADWPAPLMRPAGDRILELTVPGALPLQFAVKGRKSDWLAPSRPPEGERVLDLTLPVPARPAQVPELPVRAWGLRVLVWEASCLVSSPLAVAVAWFFPLLFLCLTFLARFGRPKACP